MLLIDKYRTPEHLEEPVKISILVIMLIFMIFFELRAVTWLLSIILISVDVLFMFSGSSGI